MSYRGVRFIVDVPGGWLSVDPRVFSAPVATYPAARAEIAAVPRSISADAGATPTEVR